MPDTPHLTWLVSLAMERFWGVGLMLTFASWLSALTGAIIYYRWQYKAETGEQKTVRSFLRFCFPSSILRNRTLRTDIIFALLIKAFDLVALAPLLVGGGVMAAYVDHLATLTFGVRERVEPGIFTWLAVVASVIIVQDFVIFIRHYGEHRIRLLWEFHKVHHSPEDLFPTANRRHHPFERFFEAATNTACAGMFIGFASYLLHVPLVDTVFFGVDAIYLLDLLSFYHLRHSHVALSFGKLEKFFLSPAQHHLHHSCEVQDWDVNFGTILAVWDRMFGTIRYTDHTYRFERGLVREERANYDSLFKLMVVPIWRAGGLMMSWFHPAQARDTTQPSDGITPLSDVSPEVLDEGLRQAVS
jgi:sterol desaturase/sphingolipid hydroxylase (fatty acid hydroxylase superfamily)